GTFGQSKSFILPFLGEKTLMKHILTLLTGILFLTGISTAQVPDFVYPPEYEQHESTILTWDYNTNVDSTVANIVNAVQEHAEVQVIYYPGQVPYDTNYIRQYIIDQGATPDNLRMIPAWTETLWVRDYGPFVGYRKQIDGTYEREVIDTRYSAYNRPNDDSVPEQLADLWGMAESDLNLDFEGGNILFDGLGRAFGSRRIAWQNPQYTEEQVRQQIMDAFHLDDFVYLEPLLNCGGGIWAHVDMWMKIIDNENILISEYPDWVPDYPVIEANVQTVANLTNAFGRPYRIHRIPAPPNGNGNYPVTLNEEMRTYTNSLIMNDLVVLPSYGLALDQEAKAVYEELFPGRSIELVNASRLTVNYGAIHCITNEVPPSAFLRILHAPIREGIPYQANVDIQGRLQTDDLTTTARLHYRKIEEPMYTSVDLPVAENLSFTGVVPDLAQNDTILYYLEAHQVDGTTRFDPAMGEEAANMFWFGAPSSVGSVKRTVEVLTYPNPSTGYIQVEIDRSEVIQRVQLYSLDGRLLGTWPGQSFQLNLQIPAKIRSGLYILEIQTERGLAQSKIRLIR
ncbi:MAG: agmatine deiminase family protein, partial [Bacteroidota bacterium]